jgi:hypothetical protein
MTSGAIAKLHLEAAIADAGTAGTDPDAVCRSLLGLVVAKYLVTRPVADVRSEFRFVAENCDPGTDHILLRP